MSSMKLYNVTATLVFPVAAPNYSKAIRLAAKLFKDPKPDELGFGDFTFQAKEVDNLSDISKEWVKSSLFNSDDKDCLLATDILSALEKEREKENLKGNAQLLKVQGMSDDEIAELIKT